MASENNDILKIHIENIHFKNVREDTSDDTEILSTDTCDFCTYTGSKQDLEKHMKAKHVGCSVCSLSFSDQSSLDSHKREVHELFKCEACDQPFNDFHPLQEHFENYHSSSSHICQS